MRRNSKSWRLEESKNLQNIHIDSSEWSNYITDIKPKIVISANWDGVSQAYRQDKHLQIENMEMVLQLAEKSKAIGADKFIAFGSQAEVAPSQISIEEDFSESQSDAYGTVKSQLSLLLRELFSDSKTQFIWVRPFSIYGPRDSSETLIQSMFHAAKLGKPFELRDSELAWSALHISDFGSAMSTIVNRNQVSGVINIGNPNAIKISEFAKLIQDSIQPFFPTWKGCWSEQSNLQAGKIPKVDKLNNMKWTQTFSLRSGVEDTVNWLMRNQANPVNEQE